MDGASYMTPRSNARGQHGPWTRHRPASLRSCENTLVHVNVRRSCTQYVNVRRGEHMLIRLWAAPTVLLRPRSTASCAARRVGCCFQPRCRKHVSPSGMNGLPPASISACHRGRGQTSILRNRMRGPGCSAEDAECGAIPQQPLSRHRPAGAHISTCA